MQDRPTATELLGAVRDFLQGEVVPALGEHRLRFRALIAANVLGVVERELAGEEGRLRAEWQRLGALLGAEGEAAPDTFDALRAGVAERKRALCARIREGEADDGPWRLDVLAYARWAVEEKLRVANPRYLKRMTNDELSPEEPRFMTSERPAHRSSLIAHRSRRRVYLMRHAEVSYFDGDGKPYRPHTVPLTPAGREQAAAAARALAPVPLDRVVVSGLPRTLETATIVVGERPLTPEVCPDLREIEGGRLADIPEADREAAIAGAFVHNLGRETRFLGGETFGSLLDRAVPAFRALCAQPGWRHLLIVAHGGVNRALLLDALGAGVASFGAIEQDPACINIIDVEDAGPGGARPRMIVRLLNYTPYNEQKLGLELTTMEQLFRAYRPG